MPIFVNRTKFEDRTKFELRKIRTAHQVLHGQGAARAERLQRLRAAQAVRAAGATALAVVVLVRAGPCAGTKYCRLQSVSAPVDYSEGWLLTCGAKCEACAACR